MSDRSETEQPRAKLAWQAPRWRSIAAKDAQMPVGKPGNGSDLGSFS